MLVDVSGSVQDTERAFQVTMRLYHDQKANRRFHAPDAEPSVPVDAPVLEIAGLDDFAVPRPINRRVIAPGNFRLDLAGSGPGGSFMGNDFRAAYAPGVTLDGSGQAVAIVSFAPYFPSNIALYEKTAGLPPVTVTNVLLDNLTGIPPPGLDDGEQAGDLELVIAMAPGAQVLCYEGSIEVDIFNRIATDNLAKQVSTSVGYGAPTPPALEQILD